MDGYVYVVDRIKDMIISGGENIYSADVGIASRSIRQWRNAPSSASPASDGARRCTPS